MHTWAHNHSWYNYSTAIFVIDNCLPKVAMRERREQWIVDWFLELCVLSVISDFWSSVESIWAWTYDESIPTWRSGALARVMRRTTNGRQSQWVEEHVSKWVWEMMLTVNHSTIQKKHSSAMELSAVFWLSCHPFRWVHLFPFHCVVVPGSSSSKIRGRRHDP